MASSNNVMSELRTSPLPAQRRERRRQAHARGARDRHRARGRSSIPRNDEQEAPNPDAERNCRKSDAGYITSRNRRESRKGLRPATRERVPRKWFRARIQCVFLSLAVDLDYEKAGDAARNPACDEEDELEERQIGLNSSTVHVTPPLRRHDRAVCRGT